MNSTEKKLILAVETATSLQSIAILEENRVLGSRSREVEGSHTRWLIPTIDELLDSLKLGMKDLHGLAVSIGPGSFTGLRAGLATMVGFRLAFDLPLVTIPTLEAMAWNYRLDNEVICPMLKARAGEVYWACFRWKGNTLVRISDDQVGPLTNLVESLLVPVWVFGEGWSGKQDSDPEEIDKMLKPVSLDIHATSAISVGLASLQRFQHRDFAPVGIAPHYVLASYAELAQSQKTCL